MRIGLRILLGYFLIVALAAFLLMRVFTQEIKPGVRQAMEDTLADTANVLARLAATGYTGQVAVELSDRDAQDRSLAHLRSLPNPSLVG